MKFTRNDSRSSRSFTLVELLVTISLIALLIGMLLPSLSRARDQAKQTICISNMGTIGKGCWMYAVESNDKFPGPLTTGNYGFRQAPGKKTAFDPRALPETYGMAEVLHTNGYMNSKDDAWVCPAARSPYPEYGNAYAFTIASMLDEKPITWLSKIYDSWLLWDNYTMEPGLTGFRGPFRGYSLPYDQRQYFHLSLLPGKYSGSPHISSNVLFYDCHAAPRYRP